MQPCRPFQQSIPDCLPVPYVRGRSRSRATLTRIYSPFYSAVHCLFFDPPVSAGQYARARGELRERNYRIFDADLLGYLIRMYGGKTVVIVCFVICDLCTYASLIK